MRVKHKILMSTSFLVISVVLCSITSSQAALPSWGPDDIITWGQQITNYVEIEQIEYGKIINDYTYLGDFTYNITAIDSVHKIYSFYKSGYSYKLLYSDRDYGAQVYSNNNLVLVNCMNVDYRWDYVKNQTRLYQISFNLPIWFLIEPDWAILNKGFQDVFNTSEIVETLADPYEPITYNWTLGDVCNDLSIKIMGRNTLEKGFYRFTETTNKWTFEFDASDTIHTRYNNGTDLIYVPFDLYKITYELEYDDGGVLSFYKSRLEYSITIHDDPVEIIKSVYEIKYALGGIEKVMKSSFATIASIGGFITLAATIVLVRKRRK